MKKIEAVVIKNRSKCEIRCGNCGKLLFVCKFLSENSEKVLDKSSQNVIIVARCTRNDCKTDNLLILS